MSIKHSFRILFLIPFLFLVVSAKAYTVTNLVATSSNGQIFLTWKNPTATNLEYRVYRCNSMITNTNKLSTKQFIGYVRDNSGKNMRKSTLQNQDFYFTINPGNGPLTSDRGLYVATSKSNKMIYYAVTVTNLSDGVEDRTINMGNNSLSTPVQEERTDPMPILQNISIKTNGDINYEYTIWGDNQDMHYYKAFNNCGSYGYNFTLVSRNPGTAGPLFIKFEHEDPFQMMGGAVCSDCNIIQLDDWLPNGKSTYWVGYNSNYDTYSDNNPVQTSGIVRTYTQNRLREIIQWAGLQPSIDKSRVYTTGTSHNGFGAMFTSLMMPSLIAATQTTVAPCLIRAARGSNWETEWCAYNMNLKTDVINKNTGDTILLWNLLDLRKMFFIDKNYDLPYMIGVNGKKDLTVGWVQSFHWFDSLNLNRQGGVWFWDQRNHSGSGKNFTTDETTLNFLRFNTLRSFPAFAYNSSNKNPGTGSATNGDPYGAINGNLDWNDNSIDDQICSYSINCFIKKFYVNGVLQIQTDSTQADITLRRLQYFHPTSGQSISWTVKNESNQIVNQGSFIYNSGPITIYDVNIYKTGSTLSLVIGNCQRIENAPIVQNSSEILTVAKSGENYEVFVNLKNDSRVEMNVIDITGRIVNNRIVAMHEGINKFFLDLHPGTYIIQVRSLGFSESKKLVF